MVQKDNNIVLLEHALREYTNTHLTGIGRSTALASINSGEYTVAQAVIREALCVKHMNLTLSYEDLVNAFQELGIEMEDYLPILKLRERVRGMRGH